MTTFTFGVQPGAASPAPAADRVQQDLFGKDVRFDGDRELTAAGDYILIEGEEALRQAIFLRLITRPGEYRLRPSYGVGADLYVKRAAHPSALDELRQRIIDNLGQERRIDQVLEVGVEKVMQNARPALRVSIRARALGRELRFRPLTVTERQGV